MRIPKRALPHTVTVEILLGTGARGKVFSEAEEWDRCYIEDKKKLLVGADGADLVSSGFVVMDPERDLPEGSMVTVWLGTPRERRSQVVGSSYAEMPRMPSNLTVYLS